MKSCKLNISNMHCSNCSGAIEKHFNSKEDIKVSVNLADNIGTFTYDETSWDEKKIAKDLKSLGYPIKKESKYDKDLIKLIICVLLTLPFVVHMILMMANHNMNHSFNYVQLILATLIELLAGGPFFLGMIRDFKNKRLGMDVLVTLGTLTAYIYSLILLISKSTHPLYFETCAMLLTILLIGKYVEKKAKSKTTSSLKALMALQEKKAKVFENDKVVIKDINDIKENEILIISHGEKIALDGIIIDGLAEIDESMITGESMPVIKKENDVILAGTLLVSGNIKIKVTSNSNNTYLSTLINKVEQIQANKPRIQKLADKIASIFVPVVVSISLVCFIVTFIITNQLDISITRAIAVLMISCPCSLGLATPLSILVGSSRAIKMSIIYNNTEIFEKASHIDSVCFDKTGTLSEGVFEVISYEASTEKAIDIIYTLESISTHPIAKALVKYAINNNAKLLDLKPQEIVGKGIVADCYFIYKENDIVYLKENEKVIAKLTIIDKIKDEARDVILDLKNNKIDVYMFTGDNKDIALKTAVSCNIDTNNVFYEIKPEDKLSLIESLQNKGKKVAFVGDGINDALALNKADLSIAMGSGSDVALNSSDITLSNNKLENINKSIKLSKKVYHNILQNFAWAFSYNIIAIPLAFIGVLSPIVAGTCMAFSNITVVLNALRLYKVKVK